MNLKNRKLNWEKKLNRNNKKLKKKNKKHIIICHKRMIKNYWKKWEHNIIKKKRNLKKNFNNFNY